jgi:hypothetical protein
VVRIRRVGIPGRFVQHHARGKSYPTRVRPEEFEAVVDLETMVGQPFDEEFYLIDLDSAGLERQRIARTFGEVHDPSPRPAIPLPAPEKTDWPFDQPRNCATFTMRQVLDGLEPILLVTPDADDHAWQFIGRTGACEEDCRIVALAAIVALDPTVLQVADLPPGWQAIRRGPGDPWERRIRPSAEESGR